MSAVAVSPVSRLEEKFETLQKDYAELNAAMLDFLRNAFDIRTKIVRSSELGVDGQRAGLLLNICHAVGADTLLAGDGGSRGYLDVEEFARAGVRVTWQNFKHPAYRQCGGAPFVAGLSAIDLLLNCGPQSRELLERSRGTEPARAPNTEPERAAA